MSGKELIKTMLKDIETELGEEIDRNFTRQGFFGEKWPARKGPLRKGGATLVDTGALRRSIKTRMTDNSITFYSELPYAAIHNEGGEIKVTPKMRSFFWAMYFKASGKRKTTKSGTLRKDKRNAQLNEEAEYWKSLALKKNGDVVRIPRRRFLGSSPAVEERVRKIIERNITDYFNNYKFEIR